MQIRQLGHRGVRRGMCNPLQPARSPALSEGLGGPGLDQSAPQGSQESFGHPRNQFRVPFSTLEALLSTHLGSSESSTSLGSSRVDQGCMPRFFFRGRRQWASALSNPPTPRGVRRGGQGPPRCTEARIVKSVGSEELKTRVGVGG